MNQLKEIKPNQLTRSAFDLIGKDWMLVTAEKDDKVNTMTASWGGLGVMWGKDVAFVVIRPQRYTKEFIDASETFSLCVLDSSYRKTLSYLGSVSGRDEDKISKSGLTLDNYEETPYFKEATTTLICKKLFNQTFDKECFVDDALPTNFYAGNDYHTLYIVEITKVLVK